MEYRAVVVLYRGETVPENVLERFVNDLRAFADADVETVDAYTLDSKDICKSIVNKVTPSIANDDVQNAAEFIRVNYLNERKPLDTLCLTLYSNVMSNNHPMLNRAIDVISNNQTIAKAIFKEKGISENIVNIIVRVKRFLDV